MIERICPHCQKGNSLDNRFCVACGQSLDRTALARVEAAPLAPLRSIPPIVLQRAGQTLAVGVAAVIAKVAVDWARRAIVRQVPQILQRGASLARVTPQSTTLEPSSPPANESTTIWSRRVVEVWEGNTLIRKTIEQAAWRKDSHTE